MSERPFFFENEGSRLFGFVHCPLSVNGQLRTEPPRGVVFCQPFAEEATISHRVMVSFARALADKGFYVLRFDYRGCGDSDGDFEEATLSTRLSDIGAAASVLMGEMGGGTLTLCGLRLGGTLAAMAAARDDSVESLILWEPIVQGRSYIDQFLRMQVMAENKWSGGFSLTRKELLDRLLEGRSVDILGFHLGPKCFEEFCNVNFVQEAGKFRGKTLIVSIGSKQRERSDLARLAKSYHDSDAPVEMIHVSERSFWIDHGDPVRELNGWFNHDVLFARTMEWLSALDEEAASCGQAQIG